MMCIGITKELSVQPSKTAGNDSCVASSVSPSAASRSASSSCVVAEGQQVGHQAAAAWWQWKSRWDRWDIQQQLRGGRKRAGATSSSS